MKTKIAIVSYLKDCLYRDKEWWIFLGLVIFLGRFPESITVSREVVVLVLLAVWIINRWLKSRNGKKTTNAH